MNFYKKLTSAIKLEFPSAYNINYISYNVVQFNVSINDFVIQDIIINDKIDMKLISESREKLKLIYNFVLS